jgi:hypothetical protein
MKNLLEDKGGRGRKWWDEGKIFEVIEGSKDK